MKFLISAIILIFLSFAASAAESSGPSMITQDQAVAIAVAKAQSSEWGGDWRTPYVVSAEIRQDQWLVHLLSMPPRSQDNLVLGHKYLYAFIDDRTGVVLKTDEGGGS